MKTQSPVVKRLKAAVAKTAARASSAKDEVRAAKARLKLARKLFKAEKKAAKQSRRKLDAALASALRRAPRPAATLELKPAVRKKRARQAVKPRIKKEPNTLRSAAEVAKSVIERLHAPPPILPPTPLIPADLVPRSGDSMRRGGDQSGE